MSSPILQQRQSLLLAAAAYVAKKLGQRSDLKTGKTRIAGEIRALVGKSKAEIVVPLAGQLIVSPQQSYSSSSAPAATELLAHVLDAVPYASRPALVKRLVKSWNDDGQLPELSQQQQEAADSLRARLTTTTAVTRNGTVVFKSDAAA